MIVIDASVVIELLLRTAAGQQLEERVLVTTETLHAPHLLDLEVIQVLRRYVRAASLSVARGNEALRDLLDLPLHRYPHDLFLPRIWELRFTTHGVRCASGGKDKGCQGQLPER